MQNAAVPHAAGAAEYRWSTGDSHPEPLEPPQASSCRRITRPFRARADDEGYYYIVDRWKDMYISGGENVYPAEIENVIYQMEAVAEVAIIGVPDDRWGEVGRAIVVLKPGCELSDSALLAHCADRLARYKLPRSVIFIDELPHNATGKVHKPTLRRLHGGAPA